MNGLGLIFLGAASLSILTIPRHLAAIPLLVCAIWMTRGQVLEIGPAKLTILNIVIAIGFLRIAVRGERLSHGVQAMDIYMLLWALCVAVTSMFHSSDTFVFRASVVWTQLGVYVLFRCFIVDAHDCLRTFQVLCMLLLPIAISMAYEKVSGSNPFAIFGGVNETATIREGHIRASGPFVHAILAGTVGATCLALAIATWGDKRKLASVLGIVASSAIVIASTSSGPILMTMFIILGIVLWRYKHQIRTVHGAAVFAIVLLAAVMNDPVYFLMAKIDLAGGSTGWHRAQLIRSSIEHLDEWWIAGTDRTRHWMPTGIYANQNHTDITNHLLQLGVWGGLPLVSLYLLVFYSGFKAVGNTVRQAARASSRPAHTDQRIKLAWILGSTLFGLLMNFLSISMFDQSVVFIYLVLACILAATALPTCTLRTKSKPARMSGYEGHVRPAVRVRP